MDPVRAHLALKNPRFRCRAASRKLFLVVDLESMAGDPATSDDLEVLREVAGDEYAFLEPLYQTYNGLALHCHGETMGLAVAPIDQLAILVEEAKDDIFGDEEDLFPFQREGIPFATIAHSGNYFSAYRGNVYYSDHDGGDDAVWGKSLEDFFHRALDNPTKFLDDAGCYTRYYDGKTDLQYIPEEFLHD